ncbi:MAG: hypothetical protein WC551_12790 [Patescibacteria group bacterium]
MLNRYSDLYPYLTPELPGCPNPVILQALQKAGRVFCLDTEVWREQLAPINLVDEQVRYVINPSWEAEVKRIRDLRINTAEGISNGDKGDPVSAALFDFYPAGGKTELGVSFSDNTVILDDSLEPAENVTGGLEVSIILVPYLNSDNIDPVFLNSWVEAIIGRAMSDLMSMTGKKWMNPGRAGYYEVQYQKARGRAKIEKIRGNTQKSTDMEA